MNGLDKFYNTASIGMDTDGIKKDARKTKIQKEYEMLNKLKTKKDEGLDVYSFLDDDTSMSDQASPYGDIFESHPEDTAGAEDQYHEDMQDVETQENLGLKSPMEATAEEKIMTDEHIDDSKTYSLEKEISSLHKKLDKIMKLFQISEEEMPKEMSKKEDDGDDDDEDYKPVPKKKKSKTVKDDEYSE